MSSVADVEWLGAVDDVQLPRPQSTRELNVVVDIHVILRTLLAIVSLLIVTGTAANCITFNVAPSPAHHLARFMYRFDLGFEPSIPNWYSSWALLACSSVLALITLAKWRAGDRFRQHWLVLAGGFLLMSLDEGVRLHEMINTGLVMLKLNGSGILHFPWAVLACALVAIIGLSYLSFLRHLSIRTRKLFLWSGGVYVMGAVIVDALGVVIVKLYGLQSVYHTLTQATEESLEMIGVMLFLYALLDYVRCQFGSIHVRLASKCKSG